MLLCVEQWGDLVPSWNTEIKLMVANAYARNGLSGNAAFLGKSLSFVPEGVVAAARLLWAHGGLEDAKRLLMRTLWEGNKDTGAKETHLLLGCVLEAMGEYEEAWKHLQGDHNGITAQSLMEVGLAELHMGRYPEAIGDFTVLLEGGSVQGKDKAHVLLKVGDAHYALKQYEEAIRFYRMVREMEAHDGEKDHGGEVLSLLRLDQCKEARDLYQKLPNSAAQQLLSEIVTTEELLHRIHTETVKRER
jgi:tetratricopeptide (TPR) repeat protein